MSSHVLYGALRPNVVRTERGICTTLRGKKQKPLQGSYHLYGGILPNSRCGGAVSKTVHPIQSHKHPVQSHKSPRPIPQAPRGLTTSAQLHTPATAPHLSGCLSAGSRGEPGCQAGCRTPAGGVFRGRAPTTEAPRCTTLRAQASRRAPAPPRSGGRSAGGAAAASGNGSSGWTVAEGQHIQRNGGCQKKGTRTLDVRYGQTESWFPDDVRMLEVRNACVDYM